MTPDYIYVYKKLDEAHLGHEEAKQWVLSNLGQVLDYIDAIKNEVVRLQNDLDYCELEAEREERRLNQIILELEGDLECDESDIAFYETEIAHLRTELETLRGKSSTGN